MATSKVSIPLKNQLGRAGSAGVMPVLHAAAVVACALTVSSCALIKGAEKPRETFELTALSNGTVQGRTSAQILVKEPNALKAIDSDRIVLKTAPNTITYLAGAQWSDTAPRILQAKLVETFENTGATRATAKPGDGLVIDYQLIGDVRRFEISGREAVIEMSIKLLSDKSGRVRATRIFTARSTASGSEAEDYVAAFDRAFAAFSDDVVNWVLTTI